MTEDHGGENYTVDLAQTPLYFQLFPLYYETESDFLMMFQDKCGFRIRLFINRAKELLCKGRSSISLTHFSPSPSEKRVIVRAKECEAR